MPTVDVQGQSLFYAIHRSPQPNAAQVILVHGAGGSHLLWPAQLRRLSGATVYALDLPGHGRSPGPGRASIEAYAGIVASFIKALELAPVTVVGHSMGGAIAQMLALQHSALMGAMVLLGTGARLRVSEAILGQIEGDFEAAAAYIVEHYWGPDAPAPLIEKGRQLLLEINPDVLYGDFVACNAFDVLDRLGEMKLPALVISATHDQLTPPKYGRYLAQHLPDASLTLIEGGGHMMMLEQPAVVADAVAQFLQQRGRTPGE